MTSPASGRRNVAGRIVGAVAALGVVVWAVRRLRRPDVVWHGPDDEGSAGDREPRVAAPAGGSSGAQAVLPE